MYPPISNSSSSQATKSASRRASVSASALRDTAAADSEGSDELMTHAAPPAPATTSASAPAPTRGASFKAPAATAQGQAQDIDFAAAVSLAVAAAASSTCVAAQTAAFANMHVQPQYCQYPAGLGNSAAARGLPACYASAANVATDVPMATA